MGALTSDSHQTGYASQGCGDTMWNSSRCRGFRHLLLRLIVAAVLYVCLPTIAEAALIGELTQLSGLSGCISQTGSGGSCTVGRGLDGAGWVAISPDGNHVYVAAFDGSFVAAFSRNATTGVLTQLSGTAGCIAENGDGVSCADGRGLAGAVAVVVSPDGNNVYVASRNNTVAIFSRNTTTGVLTQLSGTAGCIAETGDGVTCADGVALVGLRGIAISPDGKSVYVTARDGGAVAIFSRNTTTGVLTQLSGTAGCVSNDGTGGACVQVRGVQGARVVAVSPDNLNVYVASQYSSAVAVFSRNTTTGALTQLSGTAGCIADTGDGVTCADGRGLFGPIQLQLSPDGKNLYVASVGSSALTTFSRNTTTGALTQLSGTAGCIAETGDGSTCADGKGLNEVVFVTVSPDGNNVYAAAETSHALTIFSRDTTTGALTQLSGLAGCISEDGTSGTCTDGVALTGAISVTASPDGAFVYAAAYISDAISSFSRSTGTSNLMLLSSIDPPMPASKVAAAGLTGEVAYQTNNSGSGTGASSGFAIHEFESPLIQFGRLYAEVNGPTNTRLIVVNPDDQPVEVSFLIADHTGNSNYGSASIAGHEQLTGFINEAPFYAPSHFIGALTFASSKPVSVTALNVFTNERDELLVSPVPVTDLSAPAIREPQVIPDFAAGGGWATNIILVNETEDVLTGIIQVRDAAGRGASLDLDGKVSERFAYSIAPRSSEKFQASNVGDRIQTGSLQIIPAQGMPSPVGVAQISYRNAGVTLTETSIQALPPATAFRFLLDRSAEDTEAGSIYPALIVANPSRNTVTVALELENLDGSPTGITGMITLPPNGQQAAFLTEIPGFGSLSASFQGMLRVWSSIQISVVGAIIRFNERGELAVEILPPVNDSATEGTEHSLVSIRDKLR